MQITSFPLTPYICSMQLGGALRPPCRLTPAENLMDDTQAPAQLDHSHRAHDRRPTLNPPDPPWPQRDGRSTGTLEGNDAPHHLI